MKTLALVVLALLLFTGCEEVYVSGEPIVRYGERVQVINNLPYNVKVVYRSWGSSKETWFFPGEEKIITGLGDGEYLIVQVYYYFEIIGTTSFRVRGRRDGGPQLWRISTFRRIR